MLKKNREKSNFSIIEVFGCTFALLIVFFIILNIIEEVQNQQRLEESKNEGSYKISWKNKAEGFVVIAFGNKLYIMETRQTIYKDDICNYNSPFTTYARKIYGQEKKQLIFAIVERAVPVMKISRDCLMTIFPDKKISIAWIAVNQTLLKSMVIEQIPSYIKNSIN